MDRIRKIDVETLTNEQLEDIQKKLSAKSMEILEKAKQDLNKYYNVYGLEVVLMFHAVKHGEANLIVERLKTQEGN
jgi:hypothetical protein